MLYLILLAMASVVLGFITLLVIWAIRGTARRAVLTWRTDETLREPGKAARP